MDERTRPEELQRKYVVVGSNEWCDRFWKMMEYYHWLNNQPSPLVMHRSVKEDLIKEFSK